ncbi:helix-turn-helix transcriptional regulator [bacterium AH-315-I18]|nr:helix-turn-helix transcriptional regulator [bacterium AH-315-I18]
MQQLMVYLHQLARQSPDHQENWLDQTRDLLSQHLDKRIKTQQVAEQVGMTYASFRKRFVDATGISPGQFRIRQRIQQAQEQLADTQLPIAKIAASLGYPDVYNFTAQFARYAGMPPGQYRKLWQWNSTIK